MAMTSDQLKAWRERHDLSRAKAAELIGISAGMLELYERGKRRDRGEQPIEIPKAVELACAAIDAGILEYVEP